jgi:hypothetical protein
MAELARPGLPDDLVARLEGVEAAEIVIYLDQRLSLPDAEVVELLRPMLERRTVEPLIEYIGERLGQDDGHHTMRFELDNGNLRKSGLDHASIGNDELEHLAKVA